MTGLVDANISLETLPSLKALFELEEMSDDRYSQALKTGDLFDLVVIWIGVTIKSSSFLDGFDLEDTKVTLSARSGSAILGDPLDPLYPMAKEF